MSAAPRDPGQAGFALLEAIIAIAILSAAMVSIYGLLSSGLTAARRLGEANLSAEAQLSAMEVMRAVNPTATPQGAVDLGPYRVTWQARKLAGPIDQTNYPRGVGLYAITLFDTDVRVARPDGGEIARFALRQLGYDRVRDPPIPFSGPPT